MISKKKKFIFVHIPRTAGTSVEKLFSPTADAEDIKGKHSTFRSIAKSIPDLDKYFKFSIVRNPWEKLVSHYCFLKARFPHTVPKTFEEFVVTSIKPWSFREAWMYNDFLPQWEMLVDKDNRLALDFIGRFENLHEAIDVICKRIGVEVRRLPEVMRSTHQHYSIYYSEEARGVVAEKYAGDIGTFEYEFESERRV